MKWNEDLMLISPAYAQSAPGGALGGLEAFLPLILIFVIFYFLLIRPQQRRMKEHKAMLSAVRRGDKVVTNGGLIGTVVKVINEQELSLEIAENVKVRVMRDMIGNVLSKTEPVPGEASNDTVDPAAPKDAPASRLKGFFGGKK
ncbi:protein translocase subunit yajC [Rhodospirillum rubrum ATCC 11170]|uniref:Sec translocon accessory complex subunit YajC n=2 Tax=Rhodospirillum rubrum TaxID=1085 RepID=Q2RTI0_RHORT|nr:protein translocase subunit yajC [Rhodospirillum rubrum ATCC 11170]MBK5954154.1 preprotein translocase subunit YajC [Rhodospirillum rubrum]HAQ01211.1 preprotein translocase subunit YajC [Rhodospirillum rubrum]HCF17394.1 preprotein translocase subunit YajC [Rhodospirillum rubrum]